MISIAHVLAGAGALLLVAIFAGKASGRIGLPALALFLFIGMTIGSEGIGWIAFDDPGLAQSIGIAALAFILFSGGLDTRWRDVRPVLGAGIALSTVAVVITAATVGFVASLTLGLSWAEGMLIGAIVSSTDAAAVFSVMRSRGIGLSERLKRVLELESGSNDPMAVFLTVAFITLIQSPDTSILEIAPWFLVQMSLGAIVGLGAGRLLVSAINRLDLAYDGLYPVFTVAAAMVVYGGADLLGGNGFLAVYLAGLVMGSHEFIHRRSILRFHDGLGWLMQIAMFVTLGLLVFPSELLPVAGHGLLLAAVLIFVARPLGVFATLGFTRAPRDELALVSWVGLRGAVPIVLATYPSVVGLPNASLIFHVVFFIVVTSVLVQAPTIPFVARRLGVDEPPATTPRYPIEFEQAAGMDSDLVEVVIPPESPVLERKILDLGLPEEALIVLISRDHGFIVPRGATTLKEDDRLLILADAEGLDEVRRIVEPG